MVKYIILLHIGSSFIPMGSSQYNRPITTQTLKNVMAKYIILPHIRMILILM